MNADRKRVIVVDDDSFFAQMVSRLFTDRDFQTIVCFNMEDALDSLRRTDVYLVVTDIYMPGMGGVEGIETLKRDWPDVRVIAMSGGWDGMSPEDTLKAMKKIGADAGLIKPFNAEHLDAVLEELAEAA